MTSNFEDFNNERSIESISANIDNTAPDYFELLSAYIDDELTPPERNRVDLWLDNDPEIKQIYHQLLQLQSQIQNLSVPEADISVDSIAIEVFAKIDNRRRQRKHLIWGTGAIAATILAFGSGLIPGLNVPALKLANFSNSDRSEPLMVAVAVNKPAVKIPKAAVASPKNTDIAP
jgi:anti-sigma factor RsiW